MQVLTISTTAATSILLSGLIDRLELQGTGTLAVCTLTFFNGDELSDDQTTKIIFTKTDHPTESILTPHKVLNLSEYSYCILKIFSGKLDKGDRLQLYILPEN